MDPNIQHKSVRVLIYRSYEYNEQHYKKVIKKYLIKMYGLIVPDHTPIRKKCSSVGDVDIAIFTSSEHQNVY